MQELTPREKEILSFVKQGCNNGEIAVKIFVSRHTVKAHLNAIIRKTEARNCINLIYIALKKGLI